MPRTSTNFDQLPEAKTVEVNASCNNALNKSMMAMSGLLGGTIKCNIFNGSQKYINKRLDKLGVKDKTVINDRFLVYQYEGSAPMKYNKATQNILCKGVLNGYK